MQLYKISFTTTPKVYIGITSKTAAKRLEQHKTQSPKTYISKAIRKHGNPILTVLADCDNWELLCLAEQEAIKKFNSKHPFGYNFTSGGEGVYGVVLTEKARLNRLKACRLRPPVSEETRKKMSDSSKNISEETRKKYSESQKGRKHSEETKIKMSLSSKGRTVSEETKLKLSLLRIGSKASEETKVKISLSGIGRKKTKESIQKTIDYWTGRKHNKETIFKQKMAASLRVAIRYNKPFSLLP